MIDWSKISWEPLFTLRQSHFQSNVTFPLIIKLQCWLRQHRRVITQTQGRAFQTCSQGFGFLLRFHKLGWVFKRLVHIRNAAQSFVKENFWKSDLLKAPTYIRINLINPFNLHFSSTSCGNSLNPNQFLASQSIASQWVTHVKILKFRANKAISKNEKKGRKGEKKEIQT